MSSVRLCITIRCNEASYVSFCMDVCFLNPMFKEPVLHALFTVHIRPHPHTETFCGAERNLQQNDTYFWYTTSMTLPVIIYQDAEGWFLGSIPTLQGCRTQAKTLPELYERLNEVALLCVEG